MLTTIIEENVPNLKKDMPIKVQKVYKMENRLDQKRKYSSPYNNQNAKHKNKERILKATKEKGQVTYKDGPIRITPDFSIEALKARGA